MRRILTTVVAALLILAPITFAIGSGIAAAQSNPYSVTVEAPENFSTDGNQTLVVTVTDANDGTDFLNPVIEVPIQSPISLAPNAVQNVYINGNTSKTVAAQTQASTFTTGTSLAITGTIIPDGASRTYHFNVTASTPGTTTITADVRPLYNTNRNVRNSTTTTILGTGTIDVSVEDTAGNPVGGANATIDGRAVGQSASPTVVEGAHEVSVQGLSGDYPNLTVDLGVSETQSITFVKRNDTQQIQPIAYTADDTTLVTDSTSRNPGGPTTPVNTTISYTFSKDSGRVVYEVREPSVPVRGSDVEVVSGGNLVSSSVTSDATQLTINKTGTTTQVNVEYEGYPLGDVNLDATVNSNDAADVAANVTVGKSPAYADVNDDGSVSAIDAMFIAQYANKSSSDPSGYTGVN